MLDTNIPLAGKSIDTANPLASLAQGIRQNKIDQKNIQSAELKDELTRERLVGEHFQNLDQREQSRIRNVAIAAAQVKPFLDKNDTEGALNLAKSRLGNIRSRMGAGENIDDEDTVGFIQMLEAGQLEDAKAQVDAMVQVGIMTGALESPSSTTGATGALAQQLIDEGSANNMSEALQLIKGGAGARGKLEADVELGRKASEEKAIGKETGKEMGISIAKFEDFKAGLPGLEKTVSSLRDLAEAATYTDVGKFNDAVKRQLGVDVGDAAEARSKLETVIRVEVLPLLKPTFGAAFTVNEGEWLLSTLGDVNMSPREKQAQIDARVAGWVKEGERLASRVGEEVPEMNFTPNPNSPDSVDISLEDFLNGE